MTRQRGGRGRGGRSRGRGRGGNNKRIQCENVDQEVINENLVFDCLDSFDQNVAAIFTGASTFTQHFMAQNSFRDRYLAVLLACKSRAIAFSEGSKPKVLAAAWGRKDYELADALLKIPDEEFALKEVLKAVSILDAGRCRRAKEKTLRRLEAQGCRKKQKMDQIKAAIGSISKEIPPVGSLSGSLIQHVKLWLKTIPLERFQFFALHFPTEPWKKLADILHLHPSKDIPQCPWFLPFVFGEQVSEGVLLNGLTEQNVSTQVLEHKVDYTIARKFKDSLSNEAKLKIAEYTPINTILWYYEELECPGLNDILKRRIDFDGDSKVSMSYGKLMERLATFADLRDIRESQGENDTMPFIDSLMGIANKQLQSLSINLDSPVVVIGDKSSSMQVAIKTSNIIASILTKMANADLVFFDIANVVPPFIPKNVKEVMRLSRIIKAERSTNPAASLYPFYEEKKIVRTFVIVTDEEENGTYNGDNFAQLFLKYYKEVFPATLVFISFTGYDPHSMIKSLNKSAPNLKPMVFDFKQERPDLTKLDHILGVLSLKAMGFKKDIDKMKTRLEEEGLNNLLNALKV